MNNGPFFANDPIGLTLAADQHFGAGDARQDITWQLLIDDSRHLSLYSTLGLQAQAFHFFPQFCLNKATRSDVCDFFSAPRVTAIYSNYARLVATPFETLEAALEVWVKTGSLLLGRMRITNHSEETLGVAARLAAKLVSLRGSSDLKHIRQSDQTFLKGHSGNISISLTLEGLSKTVLSPSMGLEQGRQLSPGQSLTVFWQAHFQSESEGDLHAPAIQLPLNWDAEIARLNVANQARIIQISTPLAAWDAALYSSQNQAFQLLSKNPAGELQVLKCRGLHTAFPVFLNAGSLNKVDLASSLELWQLLMSLMPAQVELAAEIFSRYLSLAVERCGNGENGEPPFPCLVRLGWKIHQHYQDKAFLVAIYPALNELLRCWFDSKNDRDQDGVPEWSSPGQCGLESLAVFNLADEAALPTRISFTESIGLAALFMSELEILQKIAAILEKQEDLEELKKLYKGLERWSVDLGKKDPQPGFVDYQSHETHKSQVLFEGDLTDFGHKALYLAHPARINIRLKPQLQFKKPAPFTIVGENRNGEKTEEVVNSADLVWLPGSFFVTSREIYTRIDRFDGLNLADTRLQVYAADLNIDDISRLFCDFAVSERDDQDDRKPTISIRNLLAGTKYGLPESLDFTEDMQVVNLGWNCLLVSHLVDIGENELAFQLFSQLMGGQIGSLKSDHAGNDCWHAQTGRLQGTNNSIGSLIPVSLFLEIAGIRIYHENKVSIQGANPFPWAFKVFFKGLEVVRDGKNSTICFPNGETEHHFGSSLKTFSRLPADNLGT